MTVRGGGVCGGGGSAGAGGGVEDDQRRSAGGLPEAGASGQAPVEDAHERLDATVLAAYGFDATKDLLAQLLERNLTVAAMEKQGTKVTAPGIPPTYPDPAKLVTEDCIKP